MRNCSVIRKSKDPNHSIAEDDEKQNGTSCFCEIENMLNVRIPIKSLNFIYYF